MSNLHRRTLPFGSSRSEGSIWRAKRAYKELWGPGKKNKQPLEFVRRAGKLKCLNIVCVLCVYGH